MPKVERDHIEPGQVALNALARGTQIGAGGALFIHGAATVDMFEMTTGTFIIGNTAGQIVDDVQRMVPTKVVKTP